MEKSLDLLIAAATMLTVTLSPVASRAEPKLFRWALQADAQSLDPYSLDERLTLGVLGNVYEALVSYDADLQLVPALATEWKITSPTTWQFTLRQDVKFHNGDAFTADDVIFSWRRANGEGSDMKAYASKAKEIRKLDDHLLEVETVLPNPILPRDLAFLYIMDKQWCELNGTTTATNLQGGNPNNFASMHANGTGPFRVVERQPDVKTSFERFDNYWKPIKSNVTKAVMTPIAQDPTRVAALVSGELDLAIPIPLQDLPRLEEHPDLHVLKGFETRVIYFGMDQSRPELLYSSVKGKNPLQDRRVREALAYGLDVRAINDKVMRGSARPTGLMVASEVNGYNAELAAPHPYDPQKARQLLSEAGYPDGFALTLDCPNNRYINDEKICVAAAAMLAKIGVKVEVLAQPKSKFFAKVMVSGGYDTSFFLFGWSPNTYDAHNVLFNLLSCRDRERNAGRMNIGGYCNPRVDELTQSVQIESDPARRQAMLDEAFTITKGEVAYLPIHEQSLSWGVRAGVVVVQRADDVLDLRDVVMP